MCRFIYPSLYGKKYAIKHFVSKDFKALHYKGDKMFHIRGAMVHGISKYCSRYGIHPAGCSPLASANNCSPEKEAVVLLPSAFSGATAEKGIRVALYFVLRRGDMSQNPPQKKTFWCNFFYKKNHRVPNLFISRGEDKNPGFWGLFLVFFLCISVQLSRRGLIPGALSFGLNRAQNGQMRLLNSF